MNGPRTPTAATVVSLLVTAAVLAATPGGALVAGGAAPIVGGQSTLGVAAGQSDNGTDDGAGAVVGATVTAQSESLGEPVPAPGGPFDRAFYGRVSSFAAAYNEAPPALGLGGRFATGNVVNLHVTAGGEAAAVSFRLTADNRIEDLRAGARTDAKIRLATDLATFDRIATADAPGAAFRRALDAGDVRVTGRGAGSSVVWAVLNRLRGL